MRNIYYWIIACTISFAAMIWHIWYMDLEDEEEDEE